MQPTRRTWFPAAFALIELLVVIGVVAIILALLMRGVGTAREAARRAQCTSNMKGIALCMVSHEAAHTTYPTAMTVFTDPQGPWQSHIVSVGRESGLAIASPNWALQLLPQMEEVAIDQRLHSCMESQWNAADDCEQPDFQIGGFWADPAKRQAGEQAVPYFMVCPSAPEAQLMYNDPSTTSLENLAKANYAACLGAGMYIESIDGSQVIDEHLESHEASNSQAATSRTKQRGVVTICVNPDPRSLSPEAPPTGWRMGVEKGITAKQITDGTSKTIVASEVLTVDGRGAQPDESTDIRGCWTSASMGASTYSHYTLPNASEPDVIQGCESNLTDVPKSRRIPCQQQAATGDRAGDTYAAARSRHVGGVVAGRADGSVGFYTDDVDFALWRALGTRGAGDRVDESRK